MDRPTDHVHDDRVDHHEHDPGPEGATVRPRWVWLGVLATLVGVVVVGFGVGFASWLWIAVGALLALLGAVTAWRGGVVYDVHAGRPLKQEMAEVARDEAHTGVDPKARVHDSTAQQIAERESERTRRLIEASSATPAPPLRPIGATLLLLLAVWLVVDQFVLQYPFTVAGQNTALRDCGLAVVVGLAGLRLQLAGASRLATGLCLLCGVALVATAVLGSHATIVDAWNEGITGGLVLLASSLTLER